jgi:hypothetical protein
MTLLWKSAGMIVAPLAWSGTTQAAQILPYVDCQGLIPWSLGAVIVAAIVSVGGVGVSYHYMHQNGAVSSFIGFLSVGVGLAFTFAIFLQGAAVLLLSPCQF